MWSRKKERKKAHLWLSRPQQSTPYEASEGTVHLSEPSFRSEPGGATEAVCESECGPGSLLSEAGGADSPSLKQLELADQKLGWMLCTGRNCDVGTINGWIKRVQDFFQVT